MRFWELPRMSLDGRLQFSTNRGDRVFTFAPKLRQSCVKIVPNGEGVSNLRRLLAGFFRLHGEDQLQSPLASLRVSKLPSNLKTLLLQPSDISPRPVQLSGR